LPLSSIPSTIRPNNHSRSGFGFDPILQTEIEPFQENAVDMMTVDNLPNEMPRDASEAFGDMFIEHVLPELKKPQKCSLKQPLPQIKI
jgi:hypothetical protein